MTDDASLEAAGDVAGGPLPAAPALGQDLPEAPAARRSIFDLCAVAPLSPEERAARAAAMERSLAFGAELVRDDRGWALEVDFIEANGEAVEPWKHDRRDKRLYKRNQKVTKAAGQLIGQPGDKIEWAKRLAVLHHRQGSDIEGAVRRGLFDAIWRYDHVYDGYTVPRRYGTHFMKTGRVAAVAEEQRRKWIAEGRAPADAFWVRNRRNTGLVLVSPNPDPDAPVPDAEEIMSGAGAESVIGQAGIGDAFQSLLPNDLFDIPTEAYDPRGFYRVEADEDGGAFFIFDPEGGEAASERRRQLSERTLEELAEGFITVLDTGRHSNDPWWKQNARFLAEILPGTGHVLSAREAYLAYKAATTAMQNGDWEQALLSGGESLFNAVGAVPVFGDLLRLGKGAVKLANLLLNLGHRLEVKPQVLAMANAGGGGKPGGGTSGGIGGGTRTPGPGKTPDGPKERFKLPPSEMTLTRPAQTESVLRRYDGVGTQLYVGQGEAVATRVWKQGVPLGFNSAEQLREFTEEAFNGIRQVAPDIQIGLRGSSVTGKSYDRVRETYTGPFFDTKSIEASDFDLALVSPILIQRAKEVGIFLYRGGRRSRVLTSKELGRLGLGGLDDDLIEFMDGRTVNFMLYDTTETLQKRGTAMILR